MTRWFFLDSYVPSCDGLDSMWTTNYLSHYLLTTMLLPALKAAAPARIVHVSSEAAWVAPLDLHLLPPTPFFSKVGGATTRRSPPLLPASAAALNFRGICASFMRRLPPRPPLRRQQAVSGTQRLPQPAPPHPRVATAADVAAPGSAQQAAEPRARPGWGAPARTRGGRQQTNSQRVSAGHELRAAPRQHDQDGHSERRRRCEIRDGRCRPLYKEHCARWAPLAAQ